jgi:hypothetical protein
MSYLLDSLRSTHTYEFSSADDRLYALMSCSNNTNMNTPCSVKTSPRMVLESATATRGSKTSIR